MPSSPIHEACARQLAALPAQPWPTVILVDPGAEALLVSLDHHLALLRQVGASNLASLQSLAAAGVDANQLLLCRDLQAPQVHLLLLLTCPLSVPETYLLVSQALRGAVDACGSPAVSLHSWTPPTSSELSRLSQLLSKRGPSPSAGIAAHKLNLSLLPGPWPNSFCTTAGPCPSPTLSRLGLARTALRPSAFDLDPDEDLSPEYRSRLRSSAVALQGALAALGLNVDAAAVFSLGVGANLIANTLSHLLQEEAARGGGLAEGEDNSAVVMIMDRALDWSSAVSFAGSEADARLHALERLHTTLVLQDQAEDVLRQLAAAARQGSLTAQEAGLLGLRAASLADGEGGAFPDSAREEYAREVGPQVAAAVREAETLRAESQLRRLGPQDVALAASVLEAAFVRGEAAAGLRRAGDSALAQAGLGLLSRMGLHQSGVASAAEALRRGARVCVYVLGGVARKDVEDCERALGPLGVQVFVGGSSAVRDARDVWEDAFGQGTELSRARGGFGF